MDSSKRKYFSCHLNFTKVYSQMSTWQSVGIGVGCNLTLDVRGRSYLSLTSRRWISWLLMPWLLKSPGHQQQWYWLYRICRSFSYLRNDFKCLCQINVEEWRNVNVCSCSLWKNLARKGLNFMVLKLEYPRRTRSLSWLLMPWCHWQCMT